MKALIYFILALIICSVFFACKTRYIPLETLHTEKEYIDRWHKDSIYIKDSIMINKLGDTVYIEKYKYIYKDKFVRDSIFITDSIKIDVPYPVKGDAVPYYPRWLVILGCLGGVLVGYIAFKIIRKIKP